MARQGAPSRRRKLETSQADESRRFSTSAHKPPPVVIEIGGRDYEIDSSLDIDVVEQMLSIEEVVMGVDAPDHEVLEALIAGRNLVRDLLRESNEDVPDRLPLKADDVLGIFNFLMSGRTVATEVQEALAEGDVWGAMQEEDGKPVGPQPESDVDPEAEAGPLATRSRRRSSASEKSDAGRSTGGKASPGKSSDDTSEKLAATG